MSAKRMENESLLDSSRAILLTERRDKTIVSCSAAWFDLMGYSQEETIGSDLAQYLVPEQVEHWNNTRNGYLRGSYDDRTYYPIFVNKNGDLVHVKLNVRVDPSADDWRVIYTMVDITDLVADRSLKETLLDKSSAIILTINEAFEIESLSAAWTRRTGYSRSETINHKFFNFFASEQQESVLEICKNIHNGTYDQHSLMGKLVTKNGVLMNTSLNVEIDNSNDNWRLVVTINDITEIIETLDQFEHDELTGLLSYTGVNTYHNDDVREEDLVIYYIDLDDFKTVNDNFSFEAGDQLLRGLGQTLLDVSASEKNAFRLSGTKFVIFSPYQDWKEASDFGDKLKVAIKQTSVRSGRHRIRCTACIGFAKLSVSDKLSEVMHLAEILSREAKSMGRDHIQGATEEVMDTLNNRGVFIQIGEISAALWNGEFRYDLQPIWNTDKREIEGFEALIRWERSDGIHVSSEFLINRLKEIIREPVYQSIDTALKRDCLLALEAFPTQYVSFNYTLDQLGYEGAADDIAKHLTSVKDHVDRRIFIEAAELSTKSHNDTVTLYLELWKLERMGYKIKIGRAHV